MIGRAAFINRPRKGEGDELVIDTTIHSEKTKERLAEISASKDKKTRTNSGGLSWYQFV